MTERSDENRISATLRLIAQTEQAEETGTIEIQRLLVWYYATEEQGGRDPVVLGDLPEAA